VPGDLNGDGLTDFVVGAGGSSATEIFAYTKLASGGALTNLGTTQLDVTQANVAIALADLNGDGKPDVISGTRDAVPGYRTLYISQYHFRHHYQFRNQARPAWIV
jgi:hypothetical protein